MVVLGGLGLVMGIVLEHGPDGAMTVLSGSSAPRCLRLRWEGTREDEMNRDIK